MDSVSIEHTSIAFLESGIASWSLVGVLLSDSQVNRSNRVFLDS